MADGDSYRSSEILALSVRTGDDSVRLYRKEQNLGGSLQTWLAIPCVHIQKKIA